MMDLEEVKKVIVNQEFSKMGEKTTVCLLKLKNGFEVIGTSSCIDPKEYDLELGCELSYKNAFTKVCELEAYKKQDDIERKVYSFKLEFPGIPSLF